MCTTCDWTCLNCLDIEVLSAINPSKVYVDPDYLWKVYVNPAIPFKAHIDPLWNIRGYHVAEKHDPKLLSAKP